MSERKEDGDLSLGILGGGNCTSSEKDKLGSGWEWGEAEPNEACDHGRAYRQRMCVFSLGY